MNSLIKKYLRHTGIEMITWNMNGCVLKVSEQERLIHILLSRYVRIQIDNLFDYSVVFNK
jgi:hypothetical protein